MARLEYFKKNLGWRLLLLLFWTVLVCCALYASKGSNISVISKEYLQGFSPSRTNKVAGNVSRLQDKCEEMTPNRKDMDMLNRMLHNRRNASKHSTVHCSVVNVCDKDRPFKAHCFSSGCHVYEVRIKNGNRVISSLSSQAFSQFIESSLQQNSFSTVEDLGLYLDIHCKSPGDSRMKITGDIFSRPQCQTNVESGKAEGQISQETAMNKINVLYFRFLSEREMPVRFPGLFSLINRYVKQSNVTAMGFNKYQATTWGDDDTLSLLLQGSPGPFSYNDSLLNDLPMDGHCLRVKDLSCSKSRQQDVLITNVTSHSKLVCDGPSSDRRIMKKMCAENNLTDSETRTLLTSLLSHVHDAEGVEGDFHPLLSISILNTKDFPNSEVLDFALMNFFASLLQEKNRTVLLMSGAGNPLFLRFDLSVPLQLQASNPALLLLSTTDMSQDIHSDARQLQKSSFSMLQLHYFLRRLVGSEKDTKNSGSDLLESYDSDALYSCGGLNVKPPFTCLCGRQFVKYENDTLMAGFAEFAVSMINFRLQNSHLGYSDHKRAGCARLSGISFTNIRVGFHGKKKRILMDMNLENELFKDRVYRRVMLDIWDTEKISQAAVQLFKVDPLTPLPPPDAESDHFWKTLCQTGERLDHPSSSETVLLNRWSQQRHFGRKGRVSHVHDNCLHLFVRDFGDSISVEMANVCADRRYDVMVHVSLMNMMSLSPLPLSASLGHVDRQVLAVIVKVSYTVPTFAYRLHPDFDVFYDE